MKPLATALFATVTILTVPFGGLRAQDPGTLTAPGNLVTEGIPPIPRSVVADVKRYTEFRSATLVDWHPDRREMLISTRFGNTPQIHQVTMPGGARTQLTFLDEPVTAARYEPHGRYFVFRRDQGGSEFWQLYRYDVADARITLLTDGGRSQNSLGRWSHAGSQLAYTSTRRNGVDRDIYVMDPLQPASSRRVLDVKGGGWQVLDWSPDDRRLLVQEEISINESRLFLVDVATGMQSPLTRPAAEPVAYDDARFAADGRSAYLTTDHGSEFLRLASIDLATGALNPITTGIAWDVEAFALSPDGKTLAFSVNEAGVSTLYLLDTATNRYTAIDGVPRGVATGLRWHANSRELGFTIGSSTAVADVYSLNVRTREVSRWTSSELGGLTESALAQPALIKWRSFDGREISGFYYRPPAGRFSGKRPVIVNIHGGPEGQSRPGFLGRNNYFLNELGVAMIYPNVRGSNGYGKTFLKLDNGLLREDSVRDIGALLDWIGRQPELDAARVLVTGGSYGGYMTLAVATHYDARICCALDVVGISDFATFLRNTEAYRRDLRRAEYGDERDPKIAEFFAAIAPLNNAEKIRKPLFVVAGGNDPRVPRTESEQIVARVRRNHGQVWFLLARDEGHGFQKKANVDFQFYATVMFVKANLLREQS